MNKLFQEQMQDLLKDEYDFMQALEKPPVRVFILIQLKKMD